MSGAHVSIGAATRRRAATAGLAALMTFALAPGAVVADEGDDPLARQFAELLPQVGQGDMLGSAGAVGGNGADTIYVVGSPFDDGPGGFDTGSIVVYGVHPQNAAQPMEPFTFTLDELDGGSRFGTSVAIDGDGSTIVVGAPGAAGSAGAAFSFTIDENNVVLVNDIDAPNGLGNGAAFGTSVAVSNDGSTIVVGAPGAAGGAGAAFSFTIDENNVILVNVIDAPNDLGAGAAFGTSVAVSNDGSTIVVGAPGATNGAGVAYRIDTDENGDPVVSLINVPNELGAGAGFGTSVDIAGNLILVGAPGASNGAGAGFGFRIGDGHDILLEETFAPVGLAAGAGFGTSVAALNAFGADIALFGAPEQGDVGSAFRFELFDEDWQPAGVLSPPAHLDPTPGARYGSFVDLSFFDIQLVGAPGGGLLPEAGEFYVNRGTSAGAYRQQHAGDLLTGNEQFGTSAVSDGDFFYIGQPGYNNSTGGVSVYDRDPVTDTWNERFLIEPEGAQPGDAFGSSLDVTGQAGDSDFGLITGAPSGESAYVFDFVGGVFVQQAQVVPDSPAFSQFGFSVAIEDNLIAVGAPTDSGSIGNGGSVSLFQLDQGGGITEVDVLRGDDVANAFFGFAIDVGSGNLFVGAPNQAETEQVGVVHRYDVGQQPVQLVEKIVNEDPISPGSFFGHLVGVALDHVAVATDQALRVYEFQQQQVRQLAQLKDESDRRAEESRVKDFDFHGGNAFAGPVALLFMGYYEVHGAGSSNVSAYSQGSDGTLATVPGSEGGLFPGGLAGELQSVAALVSSDLTTIVAGLDGNRAALVEYPTPAGPDDPVVADLELGKTGSPDPVAPGGQVTYTITVTNHGPATALSVELTDVLGDGLAFVSAEPAASCQHDAGTITCALGDLANDAEKVVTIVATADPAKAGSLVSNAASVRSDSPEPDPDPHGNGAFITTLVSPGGDETAETPYEKKEAVVEELREMLPTGNRPSNRRIRQAIRHLTQSLNLDWWVDGQTLDEDDGARVFNQARNAVVNLTAKPLAGNLAVEGAIEGVLDVERSLAEKAIADAEAAGGDQGLIDLARARLAGGDRKRAEGKERNAVKAYQKAWRHAQQAVD